MSWGHGISREHGCTNHYNLEMEPKYVTKSDVQLNWNIWEKNDIRVVYKSLE